RGQVDHVGVALDAALRIDHGRAERGLLHAKLPVARLEQDLLGRAMLQARLGYDLRCGPRVPVAAVLVLLRAEAGGHADAEADYDKRDPAEDRRLSVARAPMRRARGEVASLHLGPSQLSGRGASPGVTYPPRLRMSCKGDSAPSSELDALQRH